MRDVIARAAGAATPSAAEARSKARIAERALGRVRDGAAGFPEIVGAELGGSYAKGTWLPKGADVDIFVRFRESTPGDRFEEIITEVGFGSLREYSPYVRYSQHPFIEAEIRGTRVNVVPFYDVAAGRWKSAADRSPYHTRFMKDSLTPAMRSQVRILKRFLKSAGIYGSEIAKQGFSGYVAEVLVLHFGGFGRVARAMSEIGANQVIGEASRGFDTPLVIVDPVDGDRNLAAAISGESLGRFILACRAFVRRPTMAFFQDRRPRVSDGCWGNVLGVRFGFRGRSPDTIWGQARRTVSSLRRQLRQGGFNVLRSAPYADQQGSEAYLFFLLESTRIPRVYVKRGPEFFSRDYSESFIAKNIGTTELMWVGGDLRIASLERRRHTTAAGYMTDLLRGDLAGCVPKGLLEDFGRGFRVFTGGRGLSRSVKEAAGGLISTDGSFVRLG